MAATLERTTFHAPVFGREDAARALGLSSSYVDYLIRVGTATPSVPVGDGRRKLFSRDDLANLAQRLGRALPEEGGTPKAA
jgi:hypothetical protein